MISKELLSEVLECDGVESVYVGVDRVSFSGRTDGFGEYHTTINIHELAHKVKEWAYDNKAIIDVEMVLGDTDYRYVAVPHIQNQDFCSDAVTRSNSEPEAIFKASNWILENR